MYVTFIDKFKKMRKETINECKQASYARPHPEPKDSRQAFDDDNQQESAREAVPVTTRTNARAAPPLK